MSNVDSIDIHDFLHEEDFFVKSFSNSSVVYRDTYGRHPDVVVPEKDSFTPSELREFLKPVLFRRFVQKNSQYND